MVRRALRIMSRDLNRGKVGTMWIPGCVLTCSWILKYWVHNRYYINMGLREVSRSQSELSFGSSPSGKLLRGHGPLAGAAAGGDGLQSHSRGAAL